MYRTKESERERLKNREEKDKEMKTIDFFVNFWRKTKKLTVNK